MSRSAAALFLILTAGCISSAAPASAQAPRAQAGDVDARVRALLSGIESAPTRDELVALGERGLDALIRLHADTTAVGAMRLRAITCAGWFASARAHDFLLALLHRDSLDALHLRAAIRALAAREGALAVPEIVRHAQHADVAVREAVLLSLATLASAEGVSAGERAEIGSTLAALLARETDAELVRSIRGRVQP